MTRRIFYIPTATRLAPNPLTNDFARLVQWFPKSYEANNLVETTNHGGGSYVSVEIKDRRYLDSVFDYGSRMRPPPAPKPSPTQPAIQASPPAPVISDEQRLSRLNEYLKQNRPAPAWQLVNILRPPNRSAVSPQVQTNFDGLLQIIQRDNQQMHEFTAALAEKKSRRAMELGQGLLNGADRRQRAEVIKKCSELIKEEKGVAEQLNFLFTQARQYRDDFLCDPMTGGPGDNVEYQLIEGTALVMKVIAGPDHEYERMVGEVAEAAHLLPPSDSTATIFDGIRNDGSLPRSKRLTATYDLALVKQEQGKVFEALELLKDIVRQTEGADEPLVRSDHWSESVGGAAFNALRKLRIYAEAGGDLCDCCGKVPDEPPQKPANFEAMNRLLETLWRQQIGEATNLPPIDEQLIAHKEELLPVVIYKLRTGQEVSHMLSFCGDLGTNALPALPVIVQIIHRGEPFQDYNNALYALGGIGPAAGCAKPLLILARENADNGNFNYAFKRIGPAPRRVMPQLAQLLYHKNPVICKLAAQAMIETGGLDRKQFNNLTDEQQVTSVRQWWEAAGASRQWGI